MVAYDRKFYSSQQAGSLSSAKHILPIVFDLFQPTSVVDIGCGVGTWLSVAKSLGASELQGYEGNWIRKLDLADRSLTITAAELELPLVGERHFDLAICTEVAEHLSVERGPSLVADLCRLSPVVLFSGAIPGQGGTEHINERWQSYWAALFAEHQYSAFDLVRTSVWDNDEVDFWYRQNMLIYVHQDSEHLMSHRSKCIMLDLIHPKMFGYSMPPGPSYLLRNLPRSIVRSVQKRTSSGTRS